MKKRKVALALGLCLAVGLCGASLVACGDDDNGGGGDGGELVISTTEKSDYYLAGTSKSELFKSALGEWQASAATADAVPDKIALWKTNKANTYAIEVNLYNEDEFGVVVVGQEWSGQMGYSSIAPVPAETEPIGEGGGYSTKNILVRQDGKYRFVLHVDDAGNTISYERLGNADPFATQYNYWVMGEKISGGKQMYNDLTTFKADNNKTNYTVTVNLQANEKISILAAAESAGNKGVNIDNVTLKSGADITAVAATQAEGEEEAPVAPAGPVYQYQATEAGSYTITIAETDEVDTETNSVTTKREINATKAALAEYELKFRTDADNEDLFENYEYDLELNEETGKYVFTFSVAEKPTETTPATQDETVGNLDKIVVGNYFYIDVVNKGETLVGDNAIAKPLYTLMGGFLAPWSELTPAIDFSVMEIKQAGEYTVTVDRYSFETTVTREGDPTWSYDVYAHGSYGGASWADNAVKGVATPDAATVEITLALKVGDEFGFRTYHASNAQKAGDQLDWGHGTIAGIAPGGDIITGKISVKDDYNADEDTHSAGNFKVSVAGTYKFTVTVDADGKITAITAEEVVIPAPAPTPEEE